MIRAIVCMLVAGLLASCAGQQGAAPVVDRTGRSAPPAKTPGAPSAQPGSQEPAPAPVGTAGSYTVKRGDTLYSIALEHGLDYRELAQWNALEDPSRLKVGQVLRLQGEQVQALKPGLGGTIIGRVEQKPVESRPLEGGSAVSNAAAPATTTPAAAAPADSGFVWPAKGKVIAGFSEPRSKGIDIDGKLGDPVVAAAAGRVTYIGNGIPGLGKLVVIKHDNGFITVYAHNRDILVKEQQSVTRGQKIAELGSSDADRPKLHFQIRKGSAAVDPMRYLPAL
jgi:lipoprotein NlpD